MRHPLVLLALLVGFLPGHLPAASRPSAASLIEHFGMQQIPQEGPWFTSTYTSPDVLGPSVLPQRYGGPRAFGSAIVALVTQQDFSALHRLRTDEIWHYYGGDPLELLILYPDGKSASVVLGPDVLGGQRPQFVVPRGAWQGARPLGKGADSYTLFGDTLAPGFEYTDFEMGYRDELQKAYPDRATQIAALTRREFTTRPLQAYSVGKIPAVDMSPGLKLREVVGRVASAHSERCSVAYFTLEAGRHTATSLNRTAEEYFVITEGTGSVRVGSQEVAVEPGSVVVIPPEAPHSLRAAETAGLHFYAISAPAFTPEDYVVVE